MSVFVLETRVSERGKPYFVLKCLGNGEDIAVTQEYENKSNMNQTINSLNTFIRTNGCFNVVEGK